MLRNLLTGSLDPKELEKESAAKTETQSTSKLPTKPIPIPGVDINKKKWNQEPLDYYGSVASSNMIPMPSPLDEKNETEGLDYGEEERVICGSVPSSLRGHSSLYENSKTKPSQGR